MQSTEHLDRSTRGLAGQQIALIGARLREARRISDLDLVEAAQLLTISPELLAEHEAGRSAAPRLTLVMDAARVYATTVDYLCGFVEDGDRDPVAAMQARLASRVSTDLLTLARRVVTVNVAAIRAMHPTAAEGERLASLVIEANMAMAVFQQRNPKFQDMRAGETLVRKLHMATEAATLYAATTARARRKAQALQCTTTDGPTDLPDQAQDSFNPLPALDLLALPQHLVERTATCHAEAD